MPAKDITTIQISIDGKKLIFDKNNDGGKVDFDAENDSNENSVRIELVIAKVFHKVLNFIKSDQELFQKEEFELLGEMLSKIIFGKQGDLRRSSLEDTNRNLRAGVGKSYCRIILSFDGKSNVASLPWEYVMYKFRGIDEKYYLSACYKSKFQVIRRFPSNLQTHPHPEQDKLFVILLFNYIGNDNIVPKIESMQSEYQEIITLFNSLKNLYPGKEIIELKILENYALEEVKDKVEEVIKEWKNGFGYEPAYIIHYVGHSMLDRNTQIGKLAFKQKQEEAVNWVKDRTFASLFSSDQLEVRQPSLVFFLACDSAKIGVIDNALRGVACEFTRINIPAVVGMQNDISTSQSCAFYFKVYESLLKGEDIAEAVTIGRDHLGIDHKDFLGKELQPVGETYKNNYFGSPVLFITTDEPISMIKFISEEQPGTAKEISQDAESSSKPSNITRASNAGRSNTDSTERNIRKADDLETDKPAERISSS